MMLLILGLAGTELTLAAGKGGALGVVFVVDRSDSIPESARQFSEEYIRQALQAMQPDDQAAIILFGGEGLVERPMSSFKELERFTSIPSGTQTNLAEAIQLALALYPTELARRMVILSDGNATTGDAEAAARLAASADVEVVVVPILSSIASEVKISTVVVPSQLRQGDRFNLELTLEASQPTQAEIRVYSSGLSLYQGNFDLKRGSQTFSLPLTAEQAGFTSYQVQVIPKADTFYQNNEMSAFALISGPPKILMVAPPADDPIGRQGELRGDELNILQNALSAAGYLIDTVLPYDLPAELFHLAEYTTILLVDVPARQLTNQQMQAVQTYVRDLGGGLVVVGGPTSYGVGGYYRTPLEEVLPIEIQIKDEKRRPSLAILFIIDHSGSMSETSGGVIKLELAKEAAMRSVELLMPSDRVGVIAFDDSASWVVPMTELNDPDEIIRMIGTLRPGGGTDILAGLQAMAEVLPEEKAMAKHVILLTDGGANPAGIPELVSRLNQENGITLTAVGVGSDAAPFLPEIAALGGGRYHFAADPGAIPTIFTEETMLAARSYIIEEEFLPKLLQSSPILEEIVSFPPLYGYVGTSPKETAQTILVTHKDDPLLATWQYGLGKVAAFTSDATNRWARDWVAWAEYAHFWANAVRYATGEAIAPGLISQVRLDQKQAILTVDTATSLQDEGMTGFLNGYAMRANIVAPGGSTQNIRLSQIAPGKYQGAFLPNEEGIYLIHVMGESSEANGMPVAVTTGWVYAYSAEYRLLEADPDALYRVALAGNGKIATSDPADVFVHNLYAPGTHQPLWQWLILLATLLLPIDIAIRRLAVSQNDLQKGLARIFHVLRRFQPATAGSPPRSAHMEELMRVKQTHSQVERAEIKPPEDTAPLIIPTKPLPEKKPGEASTTGSEQRQSTAAALLAKKKGRK